MFERNLLRAGTSFLMSTEPGSDWSVNFNRRSHFVTHIEINCWNPPNEKNLWTSRKGGNPLQHSLALFKELFLFSYALVGLKRDQCNGRFPHFCLQGMSHVVISNSWILFKKRYDFNLTMGTGRVRLTRNTSRDLKYTFWLTFLCNSNLVLPDQLTFVGSSFWHLPTLKI